MEGPASTGVFVVPSGIKSAKQGSIDPMNGDPDEQGWFPNIIANLWS